MTGLKHHLMAGVVTAVGRGLALAGSLCLVVGGLGLKPVYACVGAGCLGAALWLDANYGLDESRLTAGDSR